MRIIGGKYKGKKIIPPTSIGTRPTSDRAREMIFNVLLHNPAFEGEGLFNKSVLDVFAGTGALGLEAFSRGASSVYFIENSAQALSNLQVNLKAFDLPSSVVLQKDAQNLGKAPFLFDLIFLDPPYGKQLLETTLSQLAIFNWMNFNAWVVIELGKNEHFQLPSFLTLVTERAVGSTKFFFCLFQLNKK
jgi:16S rRNA (guanine966-N2)-methyltransferase